MFLYRATLRARHCRSGTSMFVDPMMEKEFAGEKSVERIGNCGMKGAGATGVSAKSREFKSCAKGPSVVHVSGRF